MNLTVNFDSNDININIIHFQEHIYFNGLSKDWMLNSVSRVFNAYTHIIVILQDYNIFKTNFDP